MTKVLPANFSPELVAIMKSALDDAFHRIDHSHRAPATKAKMAQRIVRTASEGVTDLHKLQLTRDACQPHDCGPHRRIASVFSRAAAGAKAP
jgi:hypothetical protein